MSHATLSSSKHCKALLLGVSTLVCLALSTPAMATDFVITSDNGSTNGFGTEDGATAADIADDAINGDDTVSLGIAIATGNNIGIDTASTYEHVDRNTITVSNTGSITTTGEDAYGINTDEFNTTIVSGSILTSGFNAHGIRNDDYNNTTVSGSIVTEGDEAIGIDNDRFNTTIVSGSITTGGIYANGIEIYERNTLLLSGSILTSGDRASGINSTESNDINVSGSITTGGEFAHGIENNDYSNTTVSGSIVTEGDSAHGVRNWDANTMLLSGSILTSGLNSHGIDNDHFNTNIVSGSITTTGDNADGIYNWGQANKTTISGTITTTGDNSHGIRNDDDANKTTISGYVKATGANAAALYNEDGHGNSFTLNEGATIIGDVLAKDGATSSELIFNLGSSTSYVYSVSGKGAGIGAGQWAFSDLDGRTQLVTTSGIGCTTIADAGNDTCNLVTAVGNGNAETQNELQFGTNTSMIGSLSLGGNTGGSAEVKSVAQTSKMDVWTQVYSGSLERDARTKQTSFDADYLGLTIGTPVSFKDDTLNLDLVFNMSTTELDISPTQDQEITAKSYNLGAVFRDLAPSTGLEVDAYGFIGHNSYDSKRKVMNNQQATGSETVTASYSGMEVLVGVDAQYSQAIDETLSFIGGVNASLSHEKIGSYSESKYYAWGSRTMTQLTGGIAAGLEYEKDGLTGFATLGLQRSHLTHGKSASYTNNGAAGSNTDTSGAATYGTATAGFDYAVDDNMNIIGTAGMSRASDGIKGSSVSLSANWHF